MEHIYDFLYVGYVYSFKVFWKYNYKTDFFFNNLCGILFIFVILSHFDGHFQLWHLFKWLMQIQDGSEKVLKSKMAQCHYYQTKVADIFRETQAMSKFNGKYFLNSHYL